MSEVMREVGARYRASKSEGRPAGTVAKPEREIEKGAKTGQQGHIEVIEILDSEDEDEVTKAQSQGSKSGVVGGRGVDDDVEVDVDVTVADEDEEDEEDQDEGLGDVDDLDELDELELPAMGALTLADD